MKYGLFQIIPTLDIQDRANERCKSICTYILGEEDDFIINQILSTLAISKEKKMQVDIVHIVNFVERVYKSKHF